MHICTNNRHSTGHCTFMHIHTYVRTLSSLLPHLWLLWEDADGHWDSQSKAEGGHYRLYRKDKARVWVQELGPTSGGDGWKDRCKCVHVYSSGCQQHFMHVTAHLKRSCVQSASIFYYTALTSPAASWWWEGWQGLGQGGRTWSKQSEQWPRRGQNWEWEREIGTGDCDNKMKEQWCELHKSVHTYTFTLFCNHSQINRWEYVYCTQHSPRSYDTGPCHR